MNGALRFASFSLGAGVAALVLRAIREGTQPDARAALKEAVRLWKTIAIAADDAQAELEAYQAEMAASSGVSQARNEPRRRISMESPPP